MSPSLNPIITVAVFSSVLFSAPVLSRAENGSDSGGFCQITTVMNNDQNWTFVPGKHFSLSRLHLHGDGNGQGQNLGSWAYRYDASEAMLLLDSDTWNSAYGNKELMNLLENRAMKRLLNNHPMARFIRVEDFEGQPLLDFLESLDTALQGLYPIRTLEKHELSVLKDIQRRDQDSRGNATGLNPVRMVKFSMQWGKVIKDLQTHSPHEWFEIAAAALSERSFHRARFGGDESNAFEITPSSIRIDFHEEGVAFDQDGKPIPIEAPFLTYTVERKRI
jgi:hypothetical protein